MTMVRQAEAVGVGVGVEPSSALGRKRSASASSRPTTARGRGAFGVRSVVFSVGGMSSSARRRLAARLRSELAGVRALLAKAAGFLAPEGAAPSASPPAAAPCGGGRKDGRFLAAAGIRSGGAPAVDAGGENSGRKRKVSFLLERTDDAPMEMAPDGRTRLAARPASLSPSPPPPPPRQRQAADGKIGVEEEEDVDICGGASPLATAPMSPLFPDVDLSELVGATGAKLLSPLQRKYIALADAERADARGGASTVAPPALSPLLPAGYSELVGATGVDLLSPLPREHVALADRADALGLGLVVSATATTTSPSLPPGFAELAIADAGGTKMLSPLPRKYVALAERGGVASTATTLPSLDELADATGVKMLSPLPRKYVALAEEEDDEYVDICGDASPVVLHKNHGEIIISNSSSSSPSSDSDSDSNSSSSSSSSSSSDSDSDESAAAATHAPAIPTNACVSSAQPSSAAPAAPEVAQSAKKQEEKLPDQRTAAAAAAAVVATAPPKPLTDLITRAQGAAARRRQDEKAQAREKARQELREMERTTAPAMASNFIHPLDMKLLGLAAVEHMVSADEEARCRALRSAAPSLLEKLGLFLKADDGGDKVQRQQQPSFVAGDDDDVEEGEIR
uniref:NET domain-containing protein n=1 Tax=Oryza glaberrima TaxID=4538 RepID=I1P2H4_ORYGL